MGKRQPADQISSRRRRIGSLAIAGALPLVAALTNAGTAAADPVAGDDNQSTVVETQPSTPAQPGLVLDSPFGQLNVPVPPMVSEGVRPWAETAPAAARVAARAEGGSSEAAPVIDGIDPVPTDAADPLVDVAGEPAPLVRVGRNSATGVRDIPNGPVAAVDVQGLHMPDPSVAAEVAPIAAPEGKLRFGDTQIDIPTFLTPEQAAQVNEFSADTEANLARTLDSVGFEPSRSDRIAAQTVGTAAVGAAVGVGVAAPAEVAGMMLGGFVGAMAGTPFAPAGWVVGPAIGASAAVSIIAVPAATVGATIGAAVGAVNGVLAPATAPAAVAAAPGAATAE
ncbi:MAG: hypothetical protein JWN03_3482 [Nocardia sp.]|uniref:hypothetical protein n=1 Tax=Nocardia sp. TaxID=1821 RepID=UPI002610F130|nr:hypothetical protein [Nocardia sp.]MCU1643207.1 hypothetical protein [Nocardia sp.]